RPQRADRVQKEGDRIDVVEVRMRDEDVIDQRQFGQRKIADPRARVDEDVLVDQERGGAVLLPADAARAAEYAKTHSSPILIDRAGCRRSSACLSFLSPAQLLLHALVETLDVDDQALVRALADRLALVLRAYPQRERAPF